MIECPVCTTKNGDLSVVCSHCGGYLQTKVQTLDLFDTLWMLIESPGKAFKRIILSEQKNYIHFLASVSGIGMVFVWFWLVHAGWFFENLMWLILAGLIAGPIVGIVMLYAGSVIFALCTRAAGEKRRFRDIKSVFGYSMLPLVCVTVFLIPLKLGFFGMFLFTGNPPPMLLKPVPYIVLLGMDGLSVVWVAILLAIGTRVLLSRKWAVSFLISVVTLAAVGSAFVTVPW